MARPSSNQRFKKLSADEKEVGRRIAHCRQREALSQAELASLAGISRDQLARIENGRALITMGFALALAQALQINLRWLAKEIPPAYRYIKIPPEVLNAVDISGEFLSVFDASLAEFFESEHRSYVQFLTEHGQKEIETFLQHLCPEPENLSMECIANEFWPYFLESLIALPPSMRLDFKNRLAREAAQFKLENEAGINAISAAIALKTKPGQAQFRQPTIKDYLDKKTGDSKSVAVRLKVPTWPELKKDVLRFTTKRGEKTALATYLGVSRQVFGNWLSDGSQGSPNADLTLQLLRWVEEQKKLQK